MPYAVMIGVVVMFSALLPIVGAFIACFIGAFLIILESPVKALVFVIVFLFVQQLDNNLIYLISLMYCKDNYFPAELYNEPIYFLGETGAHLTPILTRSNP